MASRVQQRAQRPGLWQPPADGRARRSIPSGASIVRLTSWRAFRAAAADHGPGEKRLFAEEALQPARPSAMSQQSHSRRARGSTTAPSRQQAPLSAYRHAQYPCISVQRALRANYVHPRFLVAPARGHAPGGLIEGYQGRGPEPTPPRHPKTPKISCDERTRFHALKRAAGSLLDHDQ